MADILLFGATGYTGKLTAHALARRGADFAIAGRDQSKLDALARETNDPDVHVAAVGDTDALVRALKGAKVLITCVGPFSQLGDTAVEAALKAGVHYIDSSGEGTFIRGLIETRSRDAGEAGIAMAPALGFDEAPADVAATLAVEGMDDPELVMTYALPSRGSSGTVKSGIPILLSSAPWIVNGQPVEVRAGEHQRWAPMPPPLGPQSSLSFPFAETHLAPLHLDLRSFRLFATVGHASRYALKALPALRAAYAFGPLKSGMEKIIEKTIEGPEGNARDQRWTLLAEAKSGISRRNVVITGKDVYGLTAETLSTAAIRMTDPDFSATGVISPVQAVGLDELRKELEQHEVSIEIHEA
jgi:short subunit dehydrogenase-like uncharacterized protein